MQCKSPTDICETGATGVDKGQDIETEWRMTLQATPRLSGSAIDPGAIESQRVRKRKNNFQPKQPEVVQAQT